jgi:hypothetical protein
VGEKFNRILVRDFKVDESFRAVRMVYFMESGKDMGTFCQELFEKLDQYDKCDDEVEIAGLLQE